MFLIAHRANNDHSFSENSKKAITNVLNMDYIAGIEIDVRITKDNRLVLIHDPIIDFISNGHGIVKYMTLSDLQKYKFGKSKEQVTLLDDVLKVNAEKMLLIELKESGNDYVRLVDEAIKLINKYSNIPIYVCSFNFNLLMYLKDNYKNVKCGLIIGFGLNKLRSINPFDFLVLSGSNLQLLRQKQYNFVFGIKTKEVKNLPENIYLITDESYKLSKIKNRDKIVRTEVNYGK